MPAALLTPESNSSTPSSPFGVNLNILGCGLTNKHHHSNSNTMSAVKVLDLPPNKICVNLASPNGKRELEKERSTDSRESTSEFSASGSSSSNGCKASSITSAGGASKLSKIGKRLRESCRNIRGKSGGANGGPRPEPKDFTSVPAANESMKARHYVAMDFTGKVGRIVEGKDCVKGYTSKDGYAYFRRKVSPKEAAPRLTESQSKVHINQPWFHKNVGRDLAQRVLATHNVDGAFLVRESSVSGGFVVSYVFNGRTFHSQALPDLDEEGNVYYSLDEGKLRFYDLLQMVEFYQLNKGSLNSKLTHYIVKSEVEARPGSPASGSESSTEASMESQVEVAKEASSSGSTMEVNDKVDSNHNTNNSQMSPEEGEEVEEEEDSHDAAMASDGDTDSAREYPRG